MSFRIKTVLGIALILTAMLAILIQTGLTLLYDASVGEMRRHAEASAELFARTVQNAVISTDLATLNSAAVQIVQSRSVVYARIYNKQGWVMAEAGDPMILALPPKNNVEPNSLPEGQPLVTIRPISVGPVVYGRVEVGNSLAAHQQLMTRARAFAAALALGGCALSILLSWLLGDYLTRQLSILRRGAEKIIAETGYQMRISGRDEIADTARMFNQVSARLADEHARLQAALNEADKAIRDQRQQEKILDAVNYLQSLFIGKADSESMFNYARDILLLWFGVECGFLSEVRDNAHPPAFHPLTSPQPPLTATPPEENIIDHCLLRQSEQLIRLQQSCVGAYGDQHCFLSLPLQLADRVIGVFTLFFPADSPELQAIDIPPVLGNTLAQLILASRDQHALEQARLELTRQQTLLSGVVNTAIDGILTLDRTGIVISANSVAEKMFRLPPGSMTGLSLLELVSPADQDELMNIILEADAADFGDLKQVTGQRVDGKTFPLELAITRMPDLDGACYNLMLRDITRRQEEKEELLRAKEQADAAYRAKSAFLATISHEIRTPMHGVLGMLELLRMTPLNPEQQDTLHTAQESAQSLLRLIDDILDFSKIEIDQMELASTPTPIRPLLQQLQGLYAQSAQHKQLDFKLDIAPELAPVLRIDPLRLRQILQNLLSNALKFTEQGSIQLRARVITQEEDNQLVSFEVIDTGVGIPYERQAGLFQPFSPQAALRRQGNTGLGLAICQKLAALMNGKIELESEPGIGTRVQLSLWIETGSPGDPVQEAPPLPPATTASEARILLAEDNPTNLKLVTMQLDKLGYQTETAVDGEQAFQKWRQDRYDLVLSDCHMPHVDGFELARRIREHEAEHPLRSRIPIIACTASPQEQERIRAAGMDDFLVKPLSLRDLAAMLEKWLHTQAHAADDAPKASREKSPRAVEDAPVDLNLLDESGENMARQLVTEFIRHCKRDISRLRDAIASDNMQNLSNISQSLTEAAQSMGAKAIGAVATQMQQSADAGLAEVQPRLLLELENRCRQLEQWHERRKEEKQLNQE